MAMLAGLFPFPHGMARMGPVLVWWHCAKHKRLWGRHCRRTGHIFCARPTGRFLSAEQATGQEGERRRKRKCTVLFQCTNAGACEAPLSLPHKLHNLIPNPLVSYILEPSPFCPLGWRASGGGGRDRPLFLGGARPPGHCCLCLCLSRCFFVVRVHQHMPILIHVVVRVVALPTFVKSFVILPAAVACANSSKFVRSSKYFSISAALLVSFVRS